MISWLLSLPAVWLIVVVVAATWLLAGILFMIVTRLGRGDRVAAMTSLSPGILSPLGVVFGLIVAFLASGIWSNASTAQSAVNTEASSLRASLLLTQVFPPAQDREMRTLVARQIDQAVKFEWPAMSRGSASISTVPTALNAALQLALRLNPRTSGQTEAQRDLVTALQNALDARRQRIIVSHSQVNGAKWFAVIMLGVLLLIAITMIHGARRGTAVAAVGIFATAIALALILLLSQDRPFDGPFAIKPAALEQVRPTI